jgi:hypothetical protein
MRESTFNGRFDEIGGEDTTEGLSIGAVARLLNEQAIPTCRRRGRWKRSTVPIQWDY